MEDSSSLAAGQLFAGRYRIVALAGRGGVGEVYEAFDSRLRRTIALKVLTNVAVEEGQQESKLLHEARATAAIEHPHIVAVYDVGVAGVSVSWSVVAFGWFGQVFVCIPPVHATATPSNSAWTCTG